MENDPFLRGAGGPHSRGPAGGTAPAYGKYGAQQSGGMRDFVMLLALPWFAFALTLILFTYAYHHSQGLCWGVLAIMGAMSFTAAASYRDGGNAAFSSVGILCLFACAFGGMVGLYNYESHMAPFYTYDESREYTNVLPSEPAASFLDAGKLQFATAAKVDTTQSVGYKHGDTYCVAPITDATSGSRIEFWAVCLNACGARRDFRCDDAGDPSARGAVALQDHGYFMPGQLEYFKRAIKEAEASFDLVSASEPMFVRWIKDPDTYQQNMFNAGTGHVAFFVFLYFLFNGVLALQANVLLRK